MNPSSHRCTTVLGLVTVTMGAGLVAAAPASAGGIGDFLSPAFGVNCANHNTGTQAAGATTAGTGAANGNLLGLPLGGALNQCGGADLPGENKGGISFGDSARVEKMNSNIVNANE
ncbi:hypothetical protein ACIQVA_39870 [Streptomyces microflavus]|uniref:hypothetical protein n=1 Tax=Streptomyces microflavus TaxID=1919 RepID=UPI003806D063